MALDQPRRSKLIWKRCLPVTPTRTEGAASSIGGSLATAPSIAWASHRGKAGASPSDPWRPSVPIHLGDPICPMDPEGWRGWYPLGLFAPKQVCDSRAVAEAWSGHAGGRFHVANGLASSRVCSLKSRVTALSVRRLRGNTNWRSRSARK